MELIIGSVPRHIALEANPQLAAEHSICGLRAWRKRAKADLIVHHAVI
jgi:hypothetical protein